MQFCKDLKVGDRVDARDSSPNVLYKPRWMEAVVTGIEPGAVTVSYHSWDDRWDETILLDSGRLAPSFSRVRNWRSTLFQGHWVEVRRGTKWYRARIIGIDGESVFVETLETKNLPSYEMIVHLHSDDLTHTYMHVGIKPTPIPGSLSI